MNRNEIETFIRDIEPFALLPARAQTELAEGVHQNKFDTKELIFLEQTDGATGYLIVQGRVALLKSSPSGKELIVELLGAKELFGVLVLLDTETYPLTARAQCPTEVLCFTRPLIQSLIKRYPELYSGFTSLLRRRLHSSHNLSRALAHDRVEVRVASVLTTLGARAEEPGRIYLGRQELADLCGITIETASRVMKSFEKDEAVSLSEVGVVKLLDLSLLERVAELGSV